MITTTKFTIVKVQRAIFPPDQKDCLVYDESHKHVVTQPVHADILKVMRKRKGFLGLKAYFEAQWESTQGVWLVGKLVSDRDW